MRQLELGEPSLLTSENVYWPAVAAEFIVTDFHDPFYHWPRRGETLTVREFVGKASAICSYNIVWEGHSKCEKGRDRYTHKLLVKIDLKFFRPADVELLICDPAKTSQIPGWKPKITFEGLICITMRADLEEISKRPR